MERIHGTTEFHIEGKTAVAIGKFDGIHLGHQRLLQEILEQKKAGLKACVFTFDPSPAVLFGFSDGRELMTLKEKREILEQMGVDILIEYPLNMESASIDPKEFVSKILVEQMQVGLLAAGDDLSFGKGGKGNWQLLEELADTYGYELKRIDKVVMDDMEISSTVIRDLLNRGQMEVVSKYMGRHFSFEGIVVPGKQLGRTLGFPTVNLMISEKKILPPYGVYSTLVWWRGKAYEAISNVGEKPTVSAERIPGIESYLYDFHEDLYGQEIKVELLAYRRPEMQFSSVEELKAQLEKDKLRH